MRKRPWMHAGPVGGRARQRVGFKRLLETHPTTAVRGVAERSIFTEKWCGYLLVDSGRVAGQVCEGLKSFYCLAWTSEGIRQEFGMLLDPQILCKRVQFISTQELRHL